MEGAPNDGTSADPAMTPIERQMQVIATSIQDLARETSRQNQELWQAIRKGPPTPHDNNQPPPRGGNGSNDQEADSHQVTRRRGGEQEKPYQSSKQPTRPDKSFKQPERQDRRGSSSRQPDHPDRSSRDPDDKTARLEKELREMRKQMGDMKNSLRAKAARNLDNLVHRADSPFIPSIADFPLPSRFKLESESIGSFVQLSRAFIDHFIGSQRRGRPPTHLLSVKQMEGESLRTFVHRFNEEAMKIDRPKEDVTVTAFMAGLRKGDFLYELCKDPPETMSKLMYEATKHMNAEDALEAMDDPPPKRRKETEDRKPEPAKQKVPKFTETPERKRTTAPPVKFNSFTPLNTPIDKLLLQIQDDPSLRWPETLIRQGKLQKYVSRPANARPAKPPAQREQAEPNRPGPVGEIRTIIGGPASGGTSRASRRAYARQVHNIMVVQRPPKNVRLDDQIISFSEEDARGTHQPHDDALVITVNIAGFTTRRVMVDNGSSADILYLLAYQQMQLDKDKLRPMDAPLVGFTGDKVCPVGIVTLPITVGTHPKTKMDDQRRTTKIGADLPPKMKESLVQFLKDNKDVFAWSHEDMPGINPSIISHKLNVDPSLRPIKQKRRVFAPERNNAIMEEVDKLLAANFIREVFYPDWLANVVMVKKSTGKWRMCVDFTDLNKACPKDSFPLPRIDQLVDSTAGHKLLTFMDAFSGYNQIVMDESDQEKTSFITSRGLFCYKVMPFGLKNAGATYQRLMNRMFHDQIGRNVEVYVDDMLVKSKEEDGHLDDLRETFQTLRKYQMKLNPSKCAFGVYSGKFLGFMISQKGIEANPDKIKAILEMQPPKNIQRSPKTDGKSSCTESLKKYLTKPPLLSPSKQGEELYLYLAVSPAAVSSALIREEERRQLPVYYTSRALRGAEERYPAYGKASIRLSDGSKKTPPILPSPHDSIAHQPPTAESDEQARRSRTTHPVNSPRKMTSPLKTSNGTSRWTNEHRWIIDKGLRWNRRGLKITRRTRNGKGTWEATELDVLSDSQLVVGQVNGDYEAKEGRMQRYLHQARHRISQFREVKLSRIPREQNTEADQLAKSASSSIADDQIKVVQQSSLQATEMNPVHGTLYKRSFSLPYLRCLAPDEGQLRHERDTRRSLRRPLRCTGFAKEDCQSRLLLAVHERLTPTSSSQRCDKCQRFANLLHSPPVELVPMTAPWPFAQWGLDIMGPFPIGRRQLKFLVGCDRLFHQMGRSRTAGDHHRKKHLELRMEGSDLQASTTIIHLLAIHKPTDKSRSRIVHYSNSSKPDLRGQRDYGQKNSQAYFGPTEQQSGYQQAKHHFRMTFGSEAVDEVRETAEARMKRYQEKMARHYNSKVKPRQLSVGDLVLRKVTLATRNPSEGEARSKLGKDPIKVIEIRRPRDISFGRHELDDDCHTHGMPNTSGSIIPKKGPTL
uniref:Reverse transcriptase domain-containing protein n=1 Tax=Fagus sylvatica TaxID=28930 RepID=A0A2N9G960_FAGSY